MGALWGRQDWLDVTTCWLQFPERDLACQIPRDTALFHSLSHFLSSLFSCPSIIFLAIYTLFFLSFSQPFPPFFPCSFLLFIHSSFYHFHNLFSFFYTLALSLFIHSFSYHFQSLFSVPFHALSCNVYTPFIISTALSSLYPCSLSSFIPSFFYDLRSFFSVLSLLFLSIYTLLFLSFPQPFSFLSLPPLYIIHSFSIISAIASIFFFNWSLSGHSYSQ